MITVLLRSGSSADRLGQGEAVHVGHVGVGEHQAIGDARLPVRFAQGLAGPRAPPATLVGCIAQLREDLFEDLAVGGVVVDHQDPHALDGHRADVPSFAGHLPSASSKRAVKWKVLPRPTSLSTQIRPPISSTSREAMASPRPVPPKRRVVVAVGLLEGLEDRLLLVGRDADARVADGEVQVHLVVATPLPAARRARPRRVR